ncbi:MAG: SemiSWEET transporter [Bacteroidota bacterium]
MDYIPIIGYVAAALTTIANFPQTYKIIKTKSTKDISFTTYTFLTIGCSLWVIYGILNNDIPLIIANAISTTICVIILILKLLSKKQLKNLSDKVN